MSRAEPPGGELRALTGLRGVAALLVVVYHFTWFWVPPGWAATLVHHLYLMVDLFFVLSGYILARQYGAGFRGWPGFAAFGDFLGRRIARVWPLYALGTVAAAFLLQPPAARGPGAILANVAMVQSWGLASSMNAPAWSISTEWTAYLLFPLLVPACLGGTRRWAVLAGLLAAAMVIGLSVVPTPWLGQAVRIGPLDINGWRSPAPILRCLADFTLGLLAFRAPAGSGGLHRRAAAAWVLAGVVVLAFIPRSDAAMVLLFPPLIAAAATGALDPAFATRPVHALGVLSYAIYLVHVFAINTLIRGFQALAARHVAHAHLLAIAPALLAVIAVAVPLHLLVERPARRALRQVLRPQAGRARSLPEISR
jgi:peptidoglycan/LPS O-acetylase OafA/YrhL